MPCFLFSSLTPRQHSWHAWVEAPTSFAVLFTLLVKIMGGKDWYPIAECRSPCSVSTKKSFCPLGWILPAHSGRGLNLLCSYWHLPFWDSFYFFFPNMWLQLNISANRVKIDASIHLLPILGTLSSIRSLHWLMVRQKVGGEPNRKQNQSPSRQKSGMHVYTPQRSGEFSICDKNTGRIIQKLLVEGAFPGCWNNEEIMWKNTLICSLAMQNSDFMKWKFRIPLMLHVTFKAVLWTNSPYSSLLCFGSVPEASLFFHHSISYLWKSKRQLGLYPSLHISWW